MSMSDPFLPEPEPPLAERDDPDAYAGELDVERALDVRADDEDDAGDELDDDDELEDDGEYDFSTRETFFRVPTVGEQLTDEQLRDELEDE